MSGPHVRITGNTVTVNGRTSSWWRLPAVRWNWRTETERNTEIVASASVWAALVGHRIHLRVSQVTSPPAVWHDRTRLAASGCLSAWDAHRARTADHLIRADFAEKVVFVGVDVPRGTSLAGLWGRHTTDDIAAVVCRPGWDAIPATLGEVEWLFRRARQVGHPNPAVSGLDQPWEPDDYPEITRTATWATEPYGRTVKITRDGVSRFVAVSVIGRSATLDSQAGPWLCVTDRLPYPVDISATFDVLPAEQTQKGLRSAILRARSQGKHYTDDHDQPPPQALQAGIDKALEVEQELDGGFGTSGVSTRVHGWIRLAVSGSTETEALKRAGEIRDLYQPLVTVVTPAGQAALAAEFEPGRRLSSTAFRRVAPAYTFAGAMPQATAVVGHDRGLYLGWTSGASGRRACFWDPWRSMETLERSGLTVVVGSLGSGKSSLVGELAYQSALSGVSTTVLDPSGPLAKLCDLPELAGRTRHIDLLSAAPGILNPRRLIPVPSRWSHPGTDAEWAHAVELANTTARTLCADVLMEMLPPVIRDQPGTLIVVRDACRQAVLHHPHDWSPRHVIDELRALAALETSWADQSRVVVDLLSDLATLPAAALVFDTGDPSLDFHDLGELAGGPPSALLTVVTMNGLSLPREDADRRDLSTDEVLSLPLLHLAAWSVQKTVYGGDRNSRSMVCFDEVHALSRIGAGRLLLATSARDSRKWNARVIMASQSAADLTDAGIANLIDGAFVLRTEDPAAQTEAIRLLGVATGAGFEPVLGTLSQGRGSGRLGFREAVWADGTGNVERIVLDLSHFPEHVRRALDTTPGVRVHTNGKVTV